MSAEPTTSTVTAVPDLAQVSNASRWRRFRLFGLAILLVVASAAGYFQWIAGQLRTAVSRMEELREAVDENGKLLSQVLDLESGLRGYLLTGDRDQLANYKAASHALPEQIDRMQDLLEGRTDALRELASLQNMLRTKRAQMRKMQALYDSMGPLLVLQTYGKDLGQYETDGMLRSAQAIGTALESEALRERARAQLLMERQTVATTVTLVIVALISVLSMFLGNRHFDALRRQELLVKELIRSQKRNAEQTTSLAHVSHEIRTPMNAIFGFSNLLHDRLQDPVNRRYIDAITSSARSLLNIINDLLDLSAIEAGKIGVVQRPTDLRELIEGVLSLLAPQAAVKGIALSHEIDGELPAALVMDGDRVRQMLVNIVGNAVKYTEVGSVRVRVEAYRGERPRTLSCAISVRDTGPGIAESELERIFEPFTRGEHEAGGTGLGLSITRRLARAMGGEVTVVSAPGQGSTFKIVLPDLALAQALAGGGGSELRLRDLPPLHLLAVDDVVLNRDVLAALFAETPHELRLASGGAEALAMLDNWYPDAVLLDIRMDGIDGFEVARRLRASERTRHIHLLAVTASKLQARQEYIGLFDGLVLKPFTEYALAQELLQVCGGQATAVEAQKVKALVPQASPAMAAAMRALLPEEWRAVSETLTISDVRSFAERVAALGIEHDSAAMQPYVRTLLAAVASFDVARIESLIAAFPLAIAELEGPATSADDKGVAV